MARIQKTGDAKSNGDLSPQERHRRFVKENREWNKKVEQSLSKLKKATFGRSASGADG
jgi:hypothetical protein